MKEVELRMFTRWYRYRYGSDPTPEITIRVLNAGIILPIASIAAMIGAAAIVVWLSLYGLTSIPITQASGIDAKAALCLPSFAHYACFSGLVTLMLWGYLSRSERSHLIATALGVGLLALVAPALYVHWPIALTLIAAIWLADARRQARGRAPIGGRLWRMWVT